MKTNNNTEKTIPRQPKDKIENNTKIDDFDFDNFDDFEFEEENKRDRETTKLSLPKMQFISTYLNTEILNTASECYFRFGSLLTEKFYEYITNKPVKSISKAIKLGEEYSKLRREHLESYTIYNSEEKPFTVESDMIDLCLGIPKEIIKNINNSLEDDITLNLTLQHSLLYGIVIEKFGTALNPEWSSTYKVSKRKLNSEYEDKVASKVLKSILELTIKDSPTESRITSLVEILDSVIMEQAIWKHHTGKYSDTFSFLIGMINSNMVKIKDEDDFES